MAAARALAVAAPDLLLVFGATPFFESPDLLEALRHAMPDTVVAGCSTAGEIAAREVREGTCAITAVAFGHTTVRAAATPLASMADSRGAGERLARDLPPAGLVAVLVLGTGVRINGSALVRGLQDSLPRGVRISGGLAADGGRFERTWTMGTLGARDDQVVAIGFYGERLAVRQGSFAGWVPFGPARKVTRCVDNILHELDGERALDIYTRYLGDYARDLPASGLLFPFEMVSRNRENRGIFRTILGVNATDGSLILAGEIDPEGYLKLMHSNTERLIDGAESAARAALGEARPAGPSLALLVSCVGRKLVMGNRVEEEVECVADLLGADATIAGFYSNGEIAEGGPPGECRLHNQTMTITLLSER